MDSVVVDSSAILAVIFNEPGSGPVIPLLRGALLSTVNLTEVHTRLLLDGVPSDFAWEQVQNMGCEICMFDEEQARQAGDLVGKTKLYGLSLGDRACLALALARRATVYTTDRAWKSLGVPVTVEVIR